MAEAQVHAKDSPCGIYGGQRDTATGLADAPYSLMYVVDGQWAC